MAAPEHTDSPDFQRATAAIVGALAHEVNNPLQGVRTLLTLWERELDDGQAVPSRLEQIRGGLARIAVSVASFARTFENLPRPPDCVPVRQLLDWIVAAVTERGAAAEIVGGAEVGVPVLAYGPEFARLIADALTFRTGGSEILKIATQADGDTVILSCLRWPPESDADWMPVAALGGSSGLAVLIHELALLCEAECTFRIGTATLSGIRLTFRTRMV